MKFGLHVTAFLICMAAAFLLGTRFGPSKEGLVTRGVEIVRDTVFVRDTVRLEADASRFTVAKRPVSADSAMERLRRIWNAQPDEDLSDGAGDRADTANCVRESFAPAAADTVVCYGFSQDGAGGSHADVEICSRELPPEKPADLHGSVDIRCGNDTARIFSRTDTVHIKGKTAIAVPWYWTIIAAAVAATAAAYAAR